MSLLSPELTAAINDARARAALERCCCPTCDAAAGEPCSSDADGVHVARLVAVDDAIDAYARRARGGA